MIGIRFRNELGKVVALWPDFDFRAFSMVAVKEIWHAGMNEQDIAYHEQSAV